MNIRLIVPNCNRSVSPTVAYGLEIARIAGGFTSYAATGGWIDGQDVLVVEPVTVFDIAFEEADVDFPRDTFHALARRIAADLHQDGVYLSIDDQVDLVKPV
jgi:hypothetical protein